MASSRRKLVALLSVLGVTVFGVFIALMWVSLERPPMRTMGETRLWYTFFLSAIGLVMYLKWKHHWILSFSLLVASVFIIINIARPEIHSKDLMPALQTYQRNLPVAFSARLTLSDR